jgi:hypothetical protein
MNTERLLNVAKALRESKHPDMFSMADQIHGCGTPACAFGHYAAREDLQQAFKIAPRWSDAYSIQTSDGSDKDVWWDDESVLEHFGIDRLEADKLFYANGCGNAKTPVEAAEYIERLVASVA